MTLNNEAWPLTIRVEDRTGRSTQHTFASLALLGKDAHCDIVLKGIMVGKIHAALEPRHGHWYLEDRGGLLSTLVNSKAVDLYGPLVRGDTIEIGAYRLHVEGSPDFSEAQRSGAPPEPTCNANSESTGAPRIQGLMPEVGRAQNVTPAIAPEADLSQERPADPDETLVTDDRVQAQGTSTQTWLKASRRMAASSLSRGTGPHAHALPPKSAIRMQAERCNPQPESEFSANELNSPRGVELRKRAHDRLIAEMDLRRVNVARMSEVELYDVVGSLLRCVLEEAPEFSSKTISREALFKSILDEVIGLGPLESLLADESITEIMVNRYDEIYVERKGQLSRAPTIFTDDHAVLGVIERIVAPLGRRIDESSPMVDARLKDGSRVNAIIPPLALKGPSVTIRKFSSEKLFGGDLVRFGSISPEMIAFLQVAVEQRANIIISGGTGSGKTTLLNVLSDFIPHNERIVTVEDAAELKLMQSNLVSLEARPPNMEGKGAVTIRELVKNTLRMRPDRIVVGECRGGEALDMLQAMNTGHDGSLTTAHANSPRDCLSRLEVMTLMAGLDLPVTAIREQIVSAIDLIVQQTRFSCGTRCVTNITEVCGLESGTVQLQDVFVFQQTGHDGFGRVQGTFRSTGYVPDFYQKLICRGIPADTSIFVE